MLLEPYTIHVWTASLTLTEEQATKILPILSTDERKRAARFQFPEHRLRYIATHFHLRQILGMYTHSSPETLAFGYTEHKKPFLTNPKNTQLHFNLSHSGEKAIYAFGLAHPLGIDIETVRNKCNFDVADRFFSDSERENLSILSDDEKRLAFYRIWARKEAMIKATGKGLTQSLSAFSVSLEDVTETIILDNQDWRLCSIAVGDAYQAALACHPSMKSIMVYERDNI